MLSHAQVRILSILVVFAVNGYVVWYLRRLHSRQPAIATDSIEISAFGQGTLVVSRCLVAGLIGIFGFRLSIDGSLIEAPSSAAAACVRLLAVCSLMGLSWYLLGALMRSSKRSLSFDGDGLWRTHLGKEQGLVRWRDICGVKEGRSALALFDQAGQMMLKVEYERESYFRIRSRIMERMSFFPPQLPFDVSLPGAKVPGSVRLAFACAAVLCVGVGVLSTSGPQSHFWAPLLFCCAVLCGLLALPRLKAIIAADGITIRGRTYRYADMRSVDASFMRVNVGQHFSQLTIDMVEGKPLVILTKGLAIDSLSLQRTLLWAMARVINQDRK